MRDWLEAAGRCATWKPHTVFRQSAPADYCTRLNTNIRSVKIGGVHLAGIPVTDDAVLELARLVDDEALAGRLETAYGRMTRVLALTIPERGTVLAAIAEDPPAGLEELRGVLLREHAWRQREGLV